MKVNFVIGGTQKGGTSALELYLRMHPSVSMAVQKEVHFFDEETLFVSPPADYGLYHACFDPDHFGKILGEATPIYMYWAPAPERIRDYNPDMKWILVLRNPIDRAYSHWNMERSRGTEALSFLEALRQERERCREAYPAQHRIYSYADRGFYTEQIRRIRQYFPAEQTLFLKSEELLYSPEASLNRVCAFLGIDPMPEMIYEKKHVGTYAAAMSESERSFLRQLFEIEIRALEKLLCWDCSDWMD